MHEVPLSIFRVEECVCFIFPSGLQATKPIVQGHLASWFLEVNTALVNFIEFDTDGRAYEGTWDRKHLQLCTTCIILCVILSQNLFMYNFNVYSLVS